MSERQIKNTIMGCAFKSNILLDGGVYDKRKIDMQRTVKDINK